MADSLFLGNTTPTGTFNEFPPPTLGMGFYFTVSGTVTALGWYQPTEDTFSGGTLSARFWRATAVGAGTELGSASKVASTLLTGWNSLPVSIPVVANTHYKIGVQSPRYYGSTSLLFLSARTSPGGYVVAYQDSVATGMPGTTWVPRNGTFRAVSDSYPADSASNFNATWYGMGLTFEPDSAPPAPSPTGFFAFL